MVTATVLFSAYTYPISVSCSGGLPYFPLARVGMAPWFKSSTSRFYPNLAIQMWSRHHSSGTSWVIRHQNLIRSNEQHLCLQRDPRWQAYTSGARSCSTSTLDSVLCSISNAWWTKESYAVNTLNSLILGYVSSIYYLFGIWYLLKLRRKYISYI